METVKNFIVGVITVIVILFLLVLFFLFRPIAIALGAVIFGVSSIFLFIVLSILTVIAIFYIITLIGLVIRKAVSGSKNSGIITK